MNLIKEVKKKKEFSGLPNSIVERALAESGNEVKEARSLLRKYFGVFLTNRVLRGKGNSLDVHMSSKKRDYEEFYEEIFRDIDNVGSIIDLGCGANGFSYEFFSGEPEYIGVEAAGQLVEQTNSFLKKKGFNAKIICADLFDVENVVDILKGMQRERVVFLFQVVDALENMKRDFSKEFISCVMKECEVLVISVPLVSLGGGKKFAVKRKWLLDFLVENYNIERDFEMFNERILVIRNKA